MKYWNKVKCSGTRILGKKSALKGIHIEALMLAWWADVSGGNGVSQTDQVSISVTTVELMLSAFKFVRHKFDDMSITIPGSVTAVAVYLQTTAGRVVASHVRDKLDEEIQVFSQAEAAQGAFPPLHFKRVPREFLLDARLHQRARFVRQADLLSRFLHLDEYEENPWREQEEEISTQDMHRWYVRRVKLADSLMADEDDKRYWPDIDRILVEYDHEWWAQMLQRVGEA